MPKASYAFCRLIGLDSNGWHIRVKRRSGIIPGITRTLCSALAAKDMNVRIETMTIANMGHCCQVCVKEYLNGTA